MNFLEENKKYWEQESIGENHMSGIDIGTFQLLTKNLFETFEGKKILDLGCGTGRIYPLFKNSEYFGVDISQKLLNIFKTKHPEARFCLTDGFDIPVEKESIDIIWCWSIFTHYPLEDIEKMLKEMKRILKKDGRIYVSYIISDNPQNYQDVNFFTHGQKEFEELLTEFKFKDMGIVFPTNECFGRQTLMELSL